MFLHAKLPCNVAVNRDRGGYLRGPHLPEILLVAPEGILGGSLQQVEPSTHSFFLPSLQCSETWVGMKAQVPDRCIAGVGLFESKGDGAVPGFALHDNE